MHFQFLIEDQSGKALIDAIIPILQAGNASATYDSKFFKGIGGFTKKNTVKETKTGKLLNDLATYLRGFNKSLQCFGFEAVVIVVLDNDDRDAMAFRAQLENVAVKNGISIDHIFCIAVEEMEAWLLGDEAALLAAYPQARQRILHTYVQDSICGTWELLADVIYPGGYHKMKKDCPSYIEIGRIKSEWAHNIGVNMNLSNNKSPSFRYFHNEISRRILAER